MLISFLKQCVTIVWASSPFVDFKKKGSLVSLIAIHSMTSNITLDLTSVATNWKILLKKNSVVTTCFVSQDKVWFYLHYTYVGAVAQLAKAYCFKVRGGGFEPPLEQNLFFSFFGPPQPQNQPQDQPPLFLQKSIWWKNKIKTRAQLASASYPFFFFHKLSNKGMPSRLLRSSRRLRKLRPMRPRLYWRSRPNLLRSLWGQGFTDGLDFLHLMV